MLLVELVASAAFIEEAHLGVALCFSERYLLELWACFELGDECVDALRDLCGAAVVAIGRHSCWGRTRVKR